MCFSVLKENFHFRWDRTKMWNLPFKAWIIVLSRWRTREVQTAIFSQRGRFVHYQSKSVQVGRQLATFQCPGSWRCNMQTLSTTLCRKQACLNTCLWWRAPARGSVIYSRCTLSSITWFRCFLTVFSLHPIWKEDAVEMWILVQLEYQLEI